MFAPADTTKIKTAKELGLSQAYWKGLWKVLYKLESGWFEQVYEYDYSSPRGLNMGRVFEQNGCGTVGCMMGWGTHFGRCAFPDEKMTAAEGAAHDHLCMPRQWSTNPDIYTPARCAKALRSYLETGKADWSRGK